MPGTVRHVSTVISSSRCKGLKCQSRSMQSENSIRLHVIEYTMICLYRASVTLAGTLGELHGVLQ
jgi:hypothetical protein